VKILLVEDSAIDRHVITNHLKSWDFKVSVATSGARARKILERRDAPRLVHANPNQVVGISFWNTKQDAERYHREQFPKITEMLLLDDGRPSGSPPVEPYDPQKEKAPAKCRGEAERDLFTCCQTCPRSHPRVYQSKSEKRSGRNRRICVPVHWRCDRENGTLRSRHCSELRNS